MNNFKRIDLDWIRGLAAFIVAALHCRDIGWIGFREFYKNSDTKLFGIDSVVSWICFPLVWGSIGVAVFFVVSGYVIHISNAIKCRDDPSWKINAMYFYKRRFFRVYSVLIYAIALTFFLDNITIYYAPEHNKLGDLSLMALVGNLLSLQGTLVNHYGTDGPLWTLAMEIQFYAVYPLLLVLCKKINLKNIIVLSIFVSMAALGVRKFFHIELFLCYYFCWLLGVYAADQQVNNPGHVHPYGKSKALIYLILGCCIYFIEPRLSIILWSISFYFYLNLYINNPIPPKFLSKIFTPVGLFSYTLYAVHEPMAVAFNAVFYSGEKVVSIYWLYVLIFIILPASYLSYMLVERRVILWLGRTNFQA